MKLLHRFSADQIDHTASNGTVPTPNRRLTLRKSSGLALAGVFICTGVVASALSLRSDDTTTNGLNNSKPQSQASLLNVQAENQQTQSANSTKNSTSVSATGTQAESHSSTSVSTSTTVHSSNDGSTQTQVTVNGQSIPVPVNGSVQQTVSGGGDVSVQVSSNNQTPNGDTDNVFLPDDVIDAMGGDY